MTPQDWLAIICLVLGQAQGMWVGWYIWRRPQLLHKRKSLQQLLDETPDGSTN
jgi:hypothetical protein